jgi:NTE family protein
MNRRDFFGFGGAVAAGWPLAAVAQAQRAPEASAGCEPPAGAPARPPETAGHSAKRWGLALGSGSTHGLAHVGVLRALSRRGVRPHAIAGTSAGAVVGALAAAGLAVERIEALARELDWSNAGRLTLPWKGLMNNAPLQAFVDRAVEGRRIEQLATPFAAVAADILDGSTVVMRSGPTGRAVGASSGVPVLFQPVRVEGRDLVDGSLVAPVPVDAARALGAAVVVAVDVAYRPRDEAPRGIGDIAFQMMHVMVNRLIEEQIGRADVVVRMDLHHLMRDSLDPDALIDAGEQAMLAAWPRLRQRIGAPAGT